VTAPASTRIRIANAPCSWGVMGGFDPALFPPFVQVLDQIVATGYEGTELGDWGYLPTEVATLAEELRCRNLAMVGALVPLALADAASHRRGLQTALRTARLLAACATGGDSSGPFVILTDANGADPVRAQHAGRIRPEQGLTPEQWRTFARGAELVARAVLEESGLRTAFHHHCAGFVETPQETDTLLGLTDPALVGLCYDTGHYAYAGGDALEGLRRYGERVWHVHFKDCYREIAARARREGWDYLRAVRNGVFYGLGGGDLDFAAMLHELRRRDYRGWIVVEDELSPGMGDPLKSAQRDRDYLRRLGI